MNNRKRVVHIFHCTMDVRFEVKIFLYARIDEYYICYIIIYVTNYS